MAGGEDRTGDLVLALARYGEIQGGDSAPDYAEGERRHADDSRTAPLTRFVRHGVSREPVHLSVSDAMLTEFSALIDREL